ncbi:hypothetical protein HPB48_012383 [Haemaphysalis longicornis]|uniref:Protein kinase domain-containing protein n=1 Tax=Haemaphysalis longicornis TaxID=44386 RepID=A0A9J6G2K6_HAELO|nr:hypothetical protein HPB48_012383 [Haemaphysalis longicornis]
MKMKTKTEGGGIMAEVWSETQRLSDIANANADAYLLAKNGYMLGTEIGSGSYASISVVAKENLAYACKIVNMKHTSHEYRTRFLPREMSILGRLHHPNITQVFQIISEARRVFIIMELATGGDLLFKVQTLGRLSEAAAHYGHQVRERAATSRDVVKLSDFSFSRYCNDPADRRKKLYSETYCGSVAYAAPEVLQGIPYYPKKADMWSLGVVLFVMMTGALPYEEGNVLLQIRLQMSRAVPFPKYLESSHEYRNIVRLLLEPVTTLRATMGTVVKHPWMRLFPDPMKRLARSQHQRGGSSLLRGPVHEPGGAPLKPQRAVEDVLSYRSDLIATRPLFPGLLASRKPKATWSLRKGRSDGDAFVETNLSTSALNRRRDSATTVKAPGSRDPSSGPKVSEVRAFFDSLKTASSIHDNSGKTASSSRDNSRMRSGSSGRRGSQQRLSEVRYYEAFTEDTLGTRLPALDEEETFLLPYPGSSAGSTGSLANDNL